jgi:hypothetical protein
MMRSVIALLAVALAASRVGAAPAVCRDAVVTAAARYTRATIKAVAGCQHRHVVDCSADARTTAVVSRAAARLSAAIALSCCGADGVCGTADDEALAAIGWNAGFCPNLDHGNCNALIADPGDIATCLACIGRAAADELAALTGAPPPASSTVSQCTTAVAKEGARLMARTSKVLVRCWDARAAGLHTNPCPLPGDGRAGPAIAAAMTRATKAICRVCGGADRACGGTDDLVPATIGFPASCPAVSVPGGAGCGGPITTLADLVECVTCAGAHDAECAGDAAVPAFLAYPTECALPPGTCSPGVECASGADCPAGYVCLDNGSGTTRYCVGPGCTADADCDGGAACQQYCTFAGCGARHCVCPGFACGASEVCIDDGGLACRQLCTQDSDCPPPLGVCVNSTFGAGLCINSSPCQ